MGGGYIKNPYTEMTYEQLQEASLHISYGKDARMLHRALKKYKSGLPIFMRYPNAPLIAPILSLLLLLLSIFLHDIPQ